MPQVYYSAQSENISTFDRESLFKDNVIKTTQTITHIHNTHTSNNRTTYV